MYYHICPYSLLLDVSFLSTQLAEFVRPRMPAAEARLPLCQRRRRPVTDTPTSGQAVTVIKFVTLHPAMVSPWSLPTHICILRWGVEGLGWDLGFGGIRVGL